MGVLFDQARAQDAAAHIGTYARKPVMFVNGSGMVLTDDDGREYLDFVSGLGVVNLGHSHPAVVSAVQEQVARLTHVSNLYHVDHRGRFIEMVAALGGPGYRVFPTNSGAEAIEGAIKLARRWGKLHKGPECVGIVTALGGFHGRTLAALAATGQPAKHEPFAPMPAGFSHVPLNDLAALEAAIGPETCAVMLEPIQGEGGVHPCTGEYLRGVRALCRDRDVLLIMDEVQTGCWRTGPALAHRRHDATADIVTLAKALANGLPVGAVVASAEVAEAFGPGDHGSTFAGGPVVCAAAVAALEALDREKLGENAARVGSYLRSGLEELARSGAPIIEVRGEGLMLAAQFEGVDAARLADVALSSGIVFNNIGRDVIRFIPPLVCDTSHVDTALGVLRDALSADHVAVGA